MLATKLISVRCRRCGQVYQVPPPEEDQRAKCRPCGHEFVIPASPRQRAKMQREASAWRHATADRVAAARMAADVSTQHRVHGHQQRRFYAAAVFALVPVLLAAIAFASFLTPATTDFGAVEQMHRGRVAKLSAPRSEFEFASVTDLIEAVEPSVVQIETASGLGSGFVLDASGLIVTCRHCIDSEFDATVVFADGRREPVTGIVVDSPKADVAVLTIEPVPGIVALPLAGRAPKKGEPIVAFGSPAGLSFTASEGMVSALRTPDELAGLRAHFRSSTRLRSDVRLIQFTALSAPGSSGGPVVDFAGNVIGIVSFAFDWQGKKFEFAISAEEIQELVAGLELTERPLWLMHTDAYRRALE
jgi:S1-C subfamily serine protease